MIKNVKDLSYISEILSNQDQAKISEMKEVMDSKAYNKAMRNIETELEVLYDKIRLIEDLNNFCENFIAEQIEYKEAMFNERLKVIEKASDLYNDPNFLVIPVPFVESTDTIYDKDGTPIDKLEIKNGQLEFPCYISEEANFTSVIRSSENQCYESTYENILHHKSAYSTFLLDEPVQDGILETVEVSIENPNGCYNLIDVNAVNCEVVNKYFISMNNDVVSEEKARKDPSIKLSRVHLELLCKTYKNDSLQLIKKCYERKLITKEYEKRPIGWDEEIDGPWTESIINSAIANKNLGYRFQNPHAIGRRFIDGIVTKDYSDKVYEQQAKNRLNKEAFDLMNSVYGFEENIPSAMRIKFAPKYDYIDKLFQKMKETGYIYKGANMNDITSGDWNSSKTKERFIDNIKQEIRRNGYNETRIQNAIDSLTKDFTGRNSYGDNAATSYGSLANSKPSYDLYEDNTWDNRGWEKSKTFRGKPKE